MKRFLNILIIAIITIAETSATIGLGFLAQLIYDDVYLEILERKEIAKREQLFINAQKDPTNSVYYSEIIFESKSKETTNQAWKTLINGANCGDASAQFIVGLFYIRWDDEMPEKLQGLGELVTQFNIDTENLEKAAYWFLQAAKQGHADAQAHLAQCYKMGFGVEQDFNKCLKWLTEATDNNSAWAQYRLGNLYYYGLSYRYNSDQRQQYWLYSIADSDYGDNENDLKKGDPIYYQKGGDKTYLNRKGLRNAVWTSTNIYLEKDIKKAKYYWKLAAEQGHKQAQEALQKIYDDDDL